MVEEDKKIENIEEHVNVILDDTYENENNGDDEYYVKSMQKVLLDNYKLVDNLQQQNLTQSLCKLSLQTFEIVVDNKNYENLNMMYMVHEIKPPPQSYVAPFNFGWENL